MNWINMKKKATQFGAWKTQPGKSSREVVERSADYYKREVPAPTKEYDPASIKVLEGMGHPPNMARHTWLNDELRRPMRLLKDAVMTL